MGNYLSILIGDNCAKVLTGIVQFPTEPQTIPHLPLEQCCTSKNRGTARAAVAPRLFISPARAWTSTL